MTDLGGIFLDAQGVGDFGEIEPFEVDHHQHFLVGWAEPVEYRVDLLGSLGADEPLARAGAAVHEPLRQPDRRVARQGEIERLFARAIPLLCTQVTPMELDDLLRGERPQPRIKRHRPVAEVAFELLARVRERFLNNV